MKYLGIIAIRNKVANFLRVRVILRYTAHWIENPFYMTGLSIEKSFLLSHICGKIIYWKLFWGFQNVILMYFGAK